MNSYFYLGFLPLHIFAVASLISSDYLNIGLILLFWVLLSGYGVGVCLHRLLSHRAFTTPKYVENILSFISCFCIQGSPLFWVAVHRGYHHRYSDQDGDIHSPIHGQLWAYFLWTCKTNPHEINYKYTPDLLRSSFHLNLSKYYFPLIWSAWIISWLISPVLFFSLVMAQLITLHLEFCVNLFCHLPGLPGSYRNFETNDNSQNYWLFGLLCWGIGYHNNHHHKPRDINFGHTSREFDPTTLLIKILPKK